MKLFKTIKDFIFDLFKFKIVYFDLLDEYEDYVRGEDVSVRNTMLGAMKNAEQYDINLKHKFYHVPAEALESPENVEYVALYRSKNLFAQNNPGVIHYGKVVSFKKMKRKDIAELMLSFSPETFYYRFEIAEWKELENRVRAKDIAPRSCYMTNLYLLKNSNYVHELYLENNNEFKLSMALTDIINGVYDGFFVGGYKVCVRFSRIKVTAPKGRFFFKIRDYKRYPRETFLKISSIIFNS